MQELFVCVVVLELGALLIFWGAIQRRARSAGIAPDLYLMLALIGWGLGFCCVPILSGMVMQEVRQAVRLRDPLPLVITQGAWFAGTLIGPGVSYVLLRMNTARHPDYEPLDERGDD
ncbi:MAG TPA: hypothetical protein VKE40_08370 [Gemmataceae bacterium]|nr:hypothetical protein [Gemmataceae bacterium]